MSRSGPAFETSTEHVPDWRDDAACHDHPKYGPNTWFPVGNSPAALKQTQEAKQVCFFQCHDDTRAACDRWADETRQDAGIWGGLSEEERSQRRRRRARERTAAANRQLSGVRDPMLPREVRNR